MSKRLPMLRGMTSTFVFLILVLVTEFLVVIYAMAIGIRDQATIQLGPLTFSLLFHLVPITMIVTLTFTWIYLKRAVRQTPQAASGPTARPEKESRLTRIRLISVAKKRLWPARSAIKVAFAVLIAFVALILLISFMAYPRLIYDSTSGVYEGDPSFLFFARSVAQAFSPILSPIAAVLKGAAPAFGALAVGVGNLFVGVALLDNASKYLVFQNGAAWILAFISFLYVAYLRRGYWFRRPRRA